MKRLYTYNEMLEIIISIMIFIILIIWINNIESNTKTDEVKYIKIPSFSEIYFTADTKDQGFNFSNPSTNDCSMIVSLIKDGEVYYESDSILPGYGLQKIKLYKALGYGDYLFTYTVKCHDINTDKEYNSVGFNVVIHVR